VAHLTVEAGDEGRLLEVAAAVDGLAVPVLVLGLTYRDGVKELAYSRALPLIERLAFHGAIVSAYDDIGIRAVVALQISDRASVDVVPFWRDLPPDVRRRIPPAGDPSALQRLVEDTLHRKPPLLEIRRTR